jgi:hypothetical protein
VNREVAENEGGNYDCGEEADIEGVDCVVDIGAILLQEHVRKGPADNGEDAINVSGNIVEREVLVINVLVLVDEVGLIAEYKNKTHDGRDDDDSFPAGIVLLDESISLDYFANWWKHTDNQ